MLSRAAGTEREPNLTEGRIRRTHLLLYQTIFLTDFDALSAFDIRYSWKFLLHKHFLTLRKKRLIQNASKFLRKT